MTVRAKAKSAASASLKFIKKTHFSTHLNEKTICGDIGMFSNKIRDVDCISCLMGLKQTLNMQLKRFEINA